MGDGWKMSEIAREISEDEWKRSFIHINIDQDLSSTESRL
jgi:hypothetical protein